MDDSLDVSVNFTSQDTQTDQGSESTDRDREKDNLVEEKGLEKEEEEEEEDYYDAHRVPDLDLNNLIRKIEAEVLKGRDWQHFKPMFYSNSI